MAHRHGTVFRTACRPSSATSRSERRFIFKSPRHCQIGVTWRAVDCPAAPITNLKDHVGVPAFVIRSQQHIAQAAAGTDQLSRNIFTPVLIPPEAHFRHAS